MASWFKTPSLEHTRGFFVLCYNSRMHEQPYNTGLAPDILKQEIITAIDNVAGIIATERINFYSEDTRRLIADYDRNYDNGTLQPITQEILGHERGLLPASTVFYVDHEGIRYQCQKAQDERIIWHCAMPLREMGDMIIWEQGKRS
jgi:hypothetical protein